MYNPHSLKENYDKMAHGKAKSEAIRDAISEADKNNDLAFQLYFRGELCYESTFYGDSLDTVIIFPEMLSLVDRHPDIPSTKYNSAYTDGMDYILWIYKWILADCTDFYQIPFDDCIKFFEDFKKRSTAYGYNLKPYYKNLALFYEKIDIELANKYTEQSAMLPADGNCDCQACQRNFEIDMALKNNDLEKAKRLSRDIEDFSLKCSPKEPMSAWLRLNDHYMDYYINKKEFDTAKVYLKNIKKHKSERTEQNNDERQIYIYVHKNPAKAIRLFQNHWKNLITNRCPYDAFDNHLYMYGFFKELEKQSTSPTVMLELDNSFPLYNETGEYNLSQLKDFYHDKALDIAEKFDARNRSDYFKNRLEEI